MGLVPAVLNTPLRPRAVAARVVASLESGGKAEVWLASLPYLGPGGLAAGNAIIDEAAVAAGRDPRAIRRPPNVPPLPVRDLTRLAVEDGIIGTFLLMGDDGAELRALAAEAPPAARDKVESARSA